MREYSKTIVVIYLFNQFEMFRTEITPKISGKKIDLKTPILTMGSCFSDHIGSKLSTNKFDVKANPFGVIFNPVSINKLLQITSANGQLDKDNWVESQGISLNYDIHSSLGEPDEDLATSNAHKIIHQTHQHLEKSKWLIITYGTAVVYTRKDTGDIVANCHKILANQFDKRMLSTEEIVDSFTKTIKQLPKDINILLTVSPVRHLKESLEVNSVSKSILRVACDELVNKYDHVHYFPAYELVLDDLRDYRFYKSDMLHPSDDAVQYVWDKFSSTYFDDDTKIFLTHWKKISNAINHSPFNVESTAHQNFVKTTINSLIELKDKVDVSKEITQLEQQLINS